MSKLPDWMPADAWAGYVEMRKKLRKPMTDRAAELRIKDLEQFRDAGHDLVVILDQSTANNWTDLYEPKDRRAPTGGPRTALPQLGRHGQATADNAQQWLETQGDQLEQKRQFAKLITGLSDYYKSEISRAVLALYWEGLRQYSYEAIEKACWAHTQLPDEAGRWMPRISDIKKTLEGRTEDQAAIAWSKVERAIRTVGQYQDVAFDDALIHRTVADMGGWLKLNLCPKEEDFVWLGKDFQTRYRGLRMRADKLPYPPTLTGLASHANHHAGIASRQGVMLIGDSAACIAVIKGGNSGPMLELTAFNPEIIAKTYPAIK